MKIGYKAGYVMWAALLVLGAHTAFVLTDQMSDRDLVTQILDITWILTGFLAGLVFGYDLFQDMERFSRLLRKAEKEIEDNYYTD